MYDVKKTEELLENIDGGIKVKDISKLLCKQIIGVRFNGRRGRMSTAIDIKYLGLINCDKTNIDEFVSSNIRNTVVYFFEKDVIRKFDNIINKVRQSMYRYSSTNDGSVYYMTEGNFLKFKEKFEETHLKEFEDLKEELIKNLSVYKDSFNKDLKEFIDSRGLPSKEADLLYKSISSRFPTKEMIKTDCSLDYYIIPFPVYNNRNLKGLNPEIIKKLEEDKDTSAVETFYDMVGSSLKQTFELIYKCMEFIDNNATSGSLPMTFDVPSKTKGYLNSQIIKLVEDNKVLRNDNLRKVISIISRTFRDKENSKGDPVTNTEAMNIAEQLLGIIYNYSCYLEIEDRFSDTVLMTEYTEEDLRTIGEISDIDNI